MLPEVRLFVQVPFVTAQAARAVGEAQTVDGELEAPEAATLIEGPAELAVLEPMELVAVA